MNCLDRSQLDSPSAITDDHLEAQRIAKQQGKVRFFGVSTHDLPAIVERIIECKFDGIQAQYRFISDQPHSKSWPRPALE